MLPAWKNGDNTCFAHSFEVVLMKIGNIVVVVILTLVWVILIENFSLFTVATGILIGSCCVFFSSRFLPLDKVKGISFGKLAFYPFYLIGQVFVSATYVSKIIFKGGKIDIVKIKTNIKNDSMRVILADSITLTPGSVMLELEGENMTILWLRERGSPAIETLGERFVVEGIMGRLEKKLIVAQEEVSE